MKKILTVLALTLFSFGLFAQSSRQVKPEKQIINGITVNWNGASKAQKEVISELLDNMVYVEGGMFIMGTDDEDDGSMIQSSPAHREKVNSFWINKYELTKKVWDAVTGNEFEVLRFPGYNDIRDFDGKENNFPVLVASYNEEWDGLLNFLKTLNRLTGLNFRLPTEAEWEFAAKGGNYSRGYEYSGSNSLDAVAWHHDNGRKVHAVGEKAPNELGIYDMSGNLSEWTSDLFTYNYNSLPEEDEELRVSRGGYFERTDCKVTSRNYGDSDGGYVGVRLVLDL